MVAHIVGLRRRRVFENRVLKNIFGPKRDEVRGEWRKQHNENEMGGECILFGGEERHIQGFGGET